MRFFDDLLGQYKMHAGIPGEQQFVSRQFAARMESPATKRILFDSRQAMLFAELGERPPQDVQTGLRPPFDQFFLELDEPIVIGGAGPDDDPNSPTSACRGFLLLRHADRDLTQVAMYFTSGDWSAKTGSGHFDARIFMLDLESGLPIAYAKTLRETGLRDQSLLADDVPDDTLVLISDRKDWSAFEWPSNLLVYAGLAD